MESRQTAKSPALQGVPAIKLGPAAVSKLLLLGVSHAHPTLGESGFWLSSLLTTLLLGAINPLWEAEEVPAEAVASFTGGGGA